MGLVGPSLTLGDRLNADDLIMNMWIKLNGTKPQHYAIAYCYVNRAHIHSVAVWEARFRLVLHTCGPFY